MMGAKEGGIPSGYVTDGLIFFLDGKQKVSGGQWTDIVGGKTFTLTDCSLSPNGGVVFNGTTSIGTYNGAVTADANNETIEAAFNGNKDSARNIFGQPYIQGNIGASMILGANDRSRRTVATVINQTRRDVAFIPAPSKTVSACDGLCVANKGTVSNTQSATPSKNNTNITTLGFRIIDTTIYTKFSGIIHAIRIYNRKLTEAEMIQNQQTDIERYGITI